MISRGDLVIYRDVLARVIYAPNKQRDIRILWHDKDGQHVQVVWASSLKIVHGDAYDRLDRDELQAAYR